MSQNAKWRSVKIREKHLFEFLDGLVLEDAAEAGGRVVHRVGEVNQVVTASPSSSI